MKQAPRVYRDSRLYFAALKTLEAGGRAIGHRRTRTIAALAWRARVRRSEEAFVELAHRVPPRLRDQNPQLYKIPRTWAFDPLVHVRRLGFELELDLRDNLQALLFFAGTYEPRLVAFLDGELRRDDVFVDVGAHVGWLSLVAARRLAEVGGGTVFAFEPTSDSADKIRRAARRNRLSVNVVQAALGRDVGEVTIRRDGNYDEHDAGVRSQYGEGKPVERVPVVPFDQWALERSLRRLDIVKIDVEGAEPEVVAGMAESLRTMRPRALVVEVKDYSFERSGGDEAALLDLLDGLGYDDQGVDLNRNRVFRPRP